MEADQGCPAGRARQAPAPSVPAPPRAVNAFEISIFARADVQSHIGNEVREVDWQLSWTYGYWIEFVSEKQMADGHRMPYYADWYAFPWREVRAKAL